MMPMLCWLAGCGMALGETPTEPPAASYISTTTPGPDGTRRAVTETYTPREGDIVLYNDHSKTWKFLYHYVGSDLPDHSGLVIKLPDGRPALLESGPDDSSTIGPYVYILDAVPRLTQFKGQFHGSIYIRRLRYELTPEQSQKLTDWGLAQEGKRYAICRLLLQATPIRCRDGLREKVFAKTYFDRGAWLCSELVVAGATRAGLFDPNVFKANRIYPRDMLYDDNYNLSGLYMPAGEWSPAPPEKVEPIQAEIPVEEDKRGTVAVQLPVANQKNRPQDREVPGIVATPFQNVSRIKPQR